MNDLFETLIRQLIQISIVASFVWIVTRVIARDRPHFSHALWALVLLKCVTPPFISSPTGPFCWDAIVRPVAHTSMDVPLPVVDTSIHEIADTVVVQFLPPTYPAVGDAQSANASPSTRDAHGRSTAAVPESLLNRADQRQLVRALSVTWLISAIILISWNCLRLLVFLSRVKAHIVDTPLAVSDSVARLERTLDLRRAIRVNIIDSPIGPAVVGILRPTILLPRTIVDGKTQNELDPLLAHEMIHIRRGDLYWALVQALATSFCWFHPLFRLAISTLNAGAERSCDEEKI